MGGAGDDIFKREFDERVGLPVVQLNLSERTTSQLKTHDLASSAPGSHWLRSKGLHVLLGVICSQSIE